MKRFCIRGLSLLLILLVLGSSALAGSGCAVIGEGLSEEEIAAMYGGLGLSRGSVPELVLTGGEAEALLPQMPESGTEAPVCAVYVELLPPDSGIVPELTNSSCTEEMFLSALSTAGITDARIVITAPYTIPGSAPMAAVCKAYEALTGTVLDPSAKALAARELTLTAVLGDDVGETDSALLVAELKSMLLETRSMTDEELAAVIRAEADKRHILLNDTQVQMLVDLCRSFEVFGELDLEKRVEDMKKMAGQLRELAEKAQEASRELSGFMERLSALFRRFRDFIDSILHRDGESSLIF